MTTTENDTLELTRLFKAPRERVFAAFTTPESMNQWFGCGSKVTTCTTDFRIGGSYRLETRNPESGETFIVTGAYREISPPAKISFTWTYEGDADWADCESVVTIQLKALGDQTELSLTHTGFPSAASKGNHSTGWNECMDKIDALLMSQPTAAR
ncbi:SRPBCC domain-containing protein [Prosthecobacter sp.]|uniref:SRPBCC family protein n=1 Tax=Prosthecobacter sp. TaxID=1965333 RepID=UPI002489B538|nr:SRPBCC domain-containing protein [Prosthecobacter sp.]MDI1315029.1 SRPBCC domain-containing protein [Prosthecobacter sp.]